MRLSKSQARRAALVAGAAGLVAAGSLLVPAVAGASTTTPMTMANVGAADSLVATLGDKTAGNYVRADGRIVVTVTDRAAADSVKAAGAVPKIVAHSAAELATATSELNRTALIPGTSWGTDPETNQVVVNYDSTVTGAKLEQLKAAVAKLGSTARIEATAGTYSTFASGGDAIWAPDGARCSLGFNVRRGSQYFFLTAGHCGNHASSWSASRGGPSLGSVQGSSFPGNDYAIIRYSGGGTPPGQVGSQDITNARTPSVGETVTRRGSTTGIHSGRVTRLNATVTYQGSGSVGGLIQTTVCAEPGDSGGSLYAGSSALGLTSGGSGNCRGGSPQTFFQPVTEALGAYGVSVY